MKIVGRVFLIALVFLLVFGLSRSRAQFFMLGNSLEGKPAPEFSVPTLSKSEVSLSQLRDGKAAILFFWATWCPHCRTALEGLDARAQEIEGQGVKIILVDVGEGKDQVQEYVDKRKVTLDILLDEDSSISSKYMVVGVPTFFLINKDGIVTSVEHSLSEDYLSLLTKAP